MKVEIMIELIQANEIYIYEQSIYPKRFESFLNEKQLKQ